MPHVIIKVYPGKSVSQKQAIADAVAQAVMTAGGHDAGSVSVGIEDVAAANWMEAVYEPEISGKPGSLYKKPGYGPAR